MPKYHINLRLIGTEHTRLYTEEADNPQQAIDAAIREAVTWGYTRAELTVVNLFLIEDPPTHAVATAEEAARSMLQLLNTPLVKDIDIAGDAMGSVVAAVMAPRVYDNLSSGEKAIANLASEVWTGRSPLWSVDLQTRRRLLDIMVQYYADGVLTLG